MATYPGKKSWRAAVATALAVVVALGAGGFVGWAVFSDSSKSSALPAPLCAGGQHGEFEQASAAACLLDAYLALVTEPAATRDARLAEIVLPARFAAERKTYRTPDTAPVNPPGKPAEFERVTAEYASVAAVKAGTSTDPGAYRAPDVGFTAWVSIVDSYDDGSTPLANWYLGHFAVRWQDGRWWLTDRFHADENATPMTYTQGPENTAFGPGWVGA
ncbi:MAG TPA: hypothetical protein VE442_15415 [Jatrophihabitans sp.]|jgi:hypothetical protein|nr:hypothetical protein [Jatrophihabitans sp.]